jgi:DNA (cytosine-5)-methyltransferase 1
VLEDEVDDKYFLSKKMLESITFQEKTNGEIANLNKGGERGSVYDVNTKSMSCLSATDYKQPKMIKVAQNVNPSGIGLNGCVYDDKGISPTLWSGHGEGLKIKSIDIRRLTPRECFRLMDFPDTFTWPVSDSQAYKQAGNSIVVNVLYKILKQLPL